MYISYNVFVTKHCKINGIHIFQNKKENINVIFLLPVKTVPELIPTTITTSESYLLSLAIIAYYKRLFPAHKQLCFEPFTVPPKVFLKLRCNFALRDARKLRKIAEETIFVSVFYHSVLH